MSSATTVCPYCNAFVTVPDPLPANCRLDCPRCLETFVYRGNVETGGGESSLTPDSRQNSYRTAPSPPASGGEDSSISPPGNEGPRVPGSFWSNRRIAFLVLWIMATMALGGLIFAWQTTAFRQANHEKLVKPEVPAIPLFIKIASGLWASGLLLILVNYLFDRLSKSESAAHGFFWRQRWLIGTGLAAAVTGLTVLVTSGPLRHRSSRTQLPPEPVLVRSLAPVQLEAIGYLPADTNVVAALHVAELLQKPAGKEFLTQLRLGPADAGPNALEKWTGLKWEEIDHLAIGLRVDDRLIPRFLLVVHTLGDFERDKVLESLQANPLPQSKDKDRYRFKLEKPPLEVFLRCPAEGRLLFVALNASDLNDIPSTAHGEAEQLPAPLRQFLKERLPQGTQAWLAGSSEHWDKTIASFWLTAQPAADRQALEKIQTFGLRLQFEHEATLGCAANCADEAAAVALKIYLERWTTQHLDNGKIFQNGTWVDGQTRGSVEKVRRALAGAD